MRGALTQWSRAEALVELRYRLRPLRAWLAAGLGGVAMLTGIAAGRPGPPPSPPATAVLVAARYLPAGAVLAPADLAVARLPTDVVPVDALSPSAAPVGRTLATALTRGTPLTGVALLQPDLYRRLGGGLVAAPVRIADPAAVALVHPGDLVEVVAAVGGSGSGVAGGGAGGPGGHAGSAGSAGATSRVVAGPARVLGVPAVPAASAGAVDSGGSLLLLAVHPSVALALAAAAVSATLSLVLLPG